MCPILLAEQRHHGVEHCVLEAAVDELLSKNVELHEG